MEIKRIGEFDFSQFRHEEEISTTNCVLLRLPKEWCRTRVCRRGRSVKYARPFVISVEDLSLSSRRFWHWERYRISSSSTFIIAPSKIHETRFGLCFTIVATSSFGWCQLNAIAALRFLHVTSPMSR